ncbi:hypothetical protein [Borreliella afzelii]|uniref:hypothetical protein n=1 Tax=Borreliella afzelii TaxID=29518 RepID=UPI0004E83765|nr:hypothetical protein [Borreliella afzelii]AIK19169.1 hypothetical protein P612_04585 [Borreliella afzelii Tom3107]AJY72871.1 lipoprotein [Borreliella afzelii K78]
MVKKIILISFLIFMMSCSAIGRGVLIDYLLDNMVNELDQEKKDEQNKSSCSKSKTKENANDQEEEEDGDENAAEELE